MANPVQELIYTVVPQNLALSSTTIPVSILVSPRLQGAATLNSFNDLLHWTKRLKDNGLTFTITAGGQSFTAHIDTSPLQPDLWEALFHSRTLVDGYVFDDHTDRSVLSYSVRDAAQVIKSAFQFAARDLALPQPPRQREGGTARGVLTRLLDGLQVNWTDAEGAAVRAAIRNHQLPLPAPRSGATGRPGGDGLPDASQLPQPGTPEARQWHAEVAARFSLFHHMPGAPKIATPDMKSILDFHRVIASVTAYPALMRALGLVFDLQLDPANIPVTGTGSPLTMSVTTAAPGWKLRIQPPEGRNNPSTAYYRVSAGDGSSIFLVAPQGGLSNATLTGLLALDPSAYLLVQFDVDGAMHKAILLAERLDLLAPARYPAVFDDANTLPSLRSSGFSLAADGRAQALLASFSRSKKFNDQMEAGVGPADADPLFAEDLVRGYRLDIWDSHSEEWHSLHRRNGVYRIGSATFETTGEEGFTQLSVAHPAPDPARDPSDNDFYLSESVARWNGWSLSVPRPGKALTRSEDPAKAIPPDDPSTQDPSDRENEAVTPFDMKVGFRVTPGSLPSLRFGRQYRVRVRPVDVAGSGLDLTDPIAGELSSTLGLPQGKQGFAYLRYEPVSPPHLVLRNPSGVSGPGGTLERMVMRTFNSDPSLDLAAPDASGSDRHVTPPRTSVEAAEQHGLFDGSNGVLKADAATYSMIARRENPAFSNFNQETIPGQVTPIQVETAAKLGTVQYLPDPLARGAAFRDLPGTPSGTRGLAAISGPVQFTPLVDVNPRQGSVTQVGFNVQPDWTQAQPFRLALSEGDAPPLWDEDNRVLTVFLPKGTQHTVALSSYMNSGDLPLMGVWQWLREFLESAMNQPVSLDLRPGSETDFTAHTLQRAQEGGHWMLTPPRLLNLVSAVQQPIGRPAFIAINVQRNAPRLSALRPLAIDTQAANSTSLELNVLEAWRAPNAVDAYLIGGLRVHGATTQKIDIVAAWDDNVDDVLVAGTLPGIVSQTTHVDELQLAELDEGFLLSSGTAVQSSGFYNPEQDTICFLLEGDTLGRSPGGRLISFDAAPRHYLNDTRYHRISYTAVATSRYRDCFDNATLDFTRRSEPVVVDVPCSARPAAPKVEYVVPTFGWERETATNVKRSVRYGGGLRVYLHRPWFSSGDGELLGVVLCGSSLGNLDDDAREQWKPFVTQWGTDPIWETGPIDESTPSPFSFPDAVSREFGLSLEENTPLDPDGNSVPVNVAGFPVAFDEVRNLWYCDLTVECGSYTPFIRLALARYQPKALADAKLSRVVLSEFVQLTPTRVATVTSDPYHPERIRVAVSGTVPRGPVPEVSILVDPLDRPTKVEVIVQQREPDVASDLGWAQAPPEVATVQTELELGAGGPSDLMLWSGTVIFAQDPAEGQFRLLITEREFISADYAELIRPEGEARAPVFAAPSRMIYSETIRLDSNEPADTDPITAGTPAGGLRSPRFWADDVLESCQRGHRIFEGSGDPPDSIARLQQALFDLGFDIEVDGIFGPETGDAVTAYKTARNLSPNDPVVGHGTMAALDADFDPYPFEAAFQACLDTVHAAIPFGSDASISNPDFTPMGFDGGPDFGFHAGWELNAPTTSPLCDLAAMFAGSLALDSATGALILTVTDDVLSRAVKHQKPGWSAPPQQVVYEGVDLGDLARTLAANGVDLAQIDALSAGNGSLDMLAGASLVTIAGTGNPGTRSYTVRALDQRNGVALDRNLSTFVEEYSALFSTLATHSLAAQVTTVRAPVSIVRGSRTRFVNASSSASTTAAGQGGLPTDFFTDRKRPARLLKEAVAAAADGDTVLILDKSTYAEGEIVIDQPMTLMGNTGGKPQDDPADPAFLAARLPTVRPRGKGRVLRIQGSSQQPLSDVSIFGLIIAGGDTDTSTPPVEIGGAGIGLIDCDSFIRIDRCLVTNNKTSSPGSLGTVNFLAKLDAAMATMPVGPSKLFMQALRAGYAASGLPTKKPNFLLGGQSFGGGICFGWSFGHVYKCQISANTTGGRGHGIGMIGYGWPVIDSCLITGNRPNSSGRRDGGGIGIEIGVPDGLTRNLTVADLLDAMIRFLTSLSSLQVLNLLNTIGINLASLPSGLALNQFNDLLPQVSLVFIRSIRGTAWSDARIRAAQTTWVYVRKNVISNNNAGEGGGGIYASVLSQVGLTQNTIKGNQALAGAGGGVRLSFGTRAKCQANEISGNRSSSAIGLGGGGVALRNVECFFGGIDGVPERISANRTGSGPGGGIDLDAIQEPDFNDDPTDPFHEQIYQAILRLRFGFRRTLLLMKAQSTVTGNKAKSGGGIFARHDDAFNVLDLRIRIDDFGGTVSLNSATDTASNNVKLVDAAKPLDINDGNVPTLISGTALDYKS